MVQEFSAGELLFPCRTPLIHPYHHERLRELLRVPEALPLEERKTVLYFSRNQDGGGGNSNSRKVGALHWRGDGRRLKAATCRGARLRRWCLLLRCQTVPLPLPATLRC